jgi:hypothetical protein
MLIRAFTLVLLSFASILPPAPHTNSLTINVTLPELLLASLNNTRTELNTQMSLLIFFFHDRPHTEH